VKFSLINVIFFHLYIFANTQIAETDSISAPNLPVFIQNYVLSTGNTLSGDKLLQLIKALLQAIYLTSPEQPPCAIGQICDSIAPNPANYNSNNLSR